MHYISTGWHSLKTIQTHLVVVRNRVARVVLLHDVRLGAVGSWPAKAELLAGLEVGAVLVDLVKVVGCELVCGDALRRGDLVAVLVALDRVGAGAGCGGSCDDGGQSE